MKRTALDKALESIDAEIAVLQAVRERLIQAKSKAPVRRPRAVRAMPAKAANE